MDASAGELDGAMPPASAGDAHGPEAPAPTSDLLSPLPRTSSVASAPTSSPHGAVVGAAVGFRGVLLSMAEGDDDCVFRVVCPDAALRLPTAASVPRGLPHDAEHKLLVTDAVTGALQHVARLAGVKLQRETTSILWVATLPITVPADNASAHHGESACAVTSMARGSIHAFDLRVPTHRVCFCFYFRSGVECDMFDALCTAARRLQRYSLLENSVRMEMAIRERLQQGKDRPATVSTPRPAAPTRGAVVVQEKRKVGRPRKMPPVESLRPSPRPVPAPAAPGAPTAPKPAPVSATNSTATAEPLAPRLLLLCPKPDDYDPSPPVAKAKRQTAARTPSPSTPAGRSPPPATTPTATASPEGARCILCGSDNQCRNAAGSLSKHPFVLQDGRGAPVLVCRVCMQRVLKLRLNVEKSLNTTTKDRVCGLCSELAPESGGRGVKPCAHLQCVRVYCNACLRKLIGRAQAHKVWRTKHWFCPNCVAVDGAPPSGPAPTNDTEPTAPARSRPPSRADRSESTKVKKRKRQSPSEDAPPMAITVSATEAPAGIPSTSGGPTGGSSGTLTSAPMSLTDYAVTYYEFLTGRETQKRVPAESEDVCFCCKDGGEVIECDWRAGNSRCPKVYHQDCLGFVVGEDDKWVCPRHRCFKCGFTAKHVCRFCVTSYCDEHLPTSVRKLGPGTTDLPRAEYVLCGACDTASLAALQEGKLSRAVYDRMLHLAYDPSSSAAATGRGGKRRTRS